MRGLSYRCLLGTLLLGGEAKLIPIGLRFEGAYILNEVSEGVFGQTGKFRLGFEVKKVQRLGPWDRE